MIKPYPQETLDKWLKDNPLEFYLACKNNPDQLYYDDEEEDEYPLWDDYINQKDIILEEDDEAQVVCD